MSIKNNIMRVFSANFLVMISGILIGFIVPAVLSIEAYSYVKTYALYISYIGFLHFGFTDGMYIKYGGRNINEIDQAEYKAEHTIFTILEILMTIIFIIFGILSKDIIIFLMGLSILPINTVSFHKFFYQAIGEFKEYTKITYSYTLIYLFLNILLAIWLKSEDYVYYCITSILANGIVYIIMELRFYKNFKNIKGKYNLSILKNFKVGFVILIANLSVILFYAIDRWFVKIFLDVNSFAYYSFAVSMLNIINVLINSVSITFFNYLSKEKKEEKIIKMKKYFILLGGLSSAAYFALAGIVSIFLPKYVPALSIISISFASFPYMIVINALYINLYKTKENEKKYLRVVVLMFIISIIYNIIAVILWKDSRSIAIATMLSFITWYFYSTKDFRYLKSNIKEISFITITTIVFLLLSNTLSWIVGGIGYLISLYIILLIFYRKDLREFKQIINGKVKEKLVMELIRK